MRLLRPARAATAARGQCRPSASLPCAIEPFEPRVLMSADVLTWHNDNARDGANLAETVLTPSNVKAKTFGKLFELKLDAAVYAQPLVMRNVSVPGKGTRDLVFVCTENASVYAFDANTGQQIWKRNFTDPAHGVTAPTAADVGSMDIGPKNALTATPVIDKVSGVLFVVTKVKRPAPPTTGGTGGDVTPDPNAGSENFEIRLRSLNVRNGADFGAGSTVISATVPGAGAGQIGERDNPMVPFNALRQNERAALTLANGTVYLTFASHGDNDPYHGWAFAYTESQLKQKAVLNLTPDGLRGPIWQGGAGPAVDSSGNLLAATGNGTFDVAVGGRDFGDSVIRINTAGGASLKVADYFTPKDQAFLLQKDADLGSDGVVLLPNHEAVVGDKRGRLYVVNPQNLGKFSLTGDHVVQEVNAFGGTQLYSTAAYFNGRIFLAANGDYLRQFTVGADGRLTQTARSYEHYGYPGATPSVSANGSSNGIVWTIERQATTPDEGGSSGKTILHAYRADGSLYELYNAAMGSSRDLPSGGPVKFSVPTIANGHVYVGTTNSLVVYGLLSSTASVASASAAVARPAAAAPPSSQASVVFSSRGIDALVLSDAGDRL